MVASLLRLAASPSASIFGIAAPLLGIALGAYLAGKLAKYAGLYHGALVGVGYVLAEAIGLAPSPLELSGDGLTEGLSVIAGFFFSSRRRHTRSKRDWSSDVCSSD